MCPMKKVGIVSTIKPSVKQKIVKGDSVIYKGYKHYVDSTTKSRRGQRAEVTFIEYPSDHKQLGRNMHIKFEDGYEMFVVEAELMLPNTQVVPLSH